MIELLDNLKSAALDSAAEDSTSDKVRLTLCKLVKSLDSVKKVLAEDNAKPSAPPPLPTKGVVTGKEPVKKDPVLGAKSEFNI